MHFFLEDVIVLSFFLASLLLISFIVFSLYLISRNGFYISANCWFCNEWTKVAYKDRNSFECSSCLQYNGFKKDGSYNKIIKAQYVNSSMKYTTNKTDSYENGLCTYCNNNQQLKVYQLAKFSPINEENYDLEIEHFQKQLEKAYKLCKKCEKILKSTINRQHSWLFGNRLKNLRKKGAASNLNVTKAKEIQNKNSHILRFIRLMLIVLAISVLCNTLDIRIVYPNINLNQRLPINVFNSYKIILMNFYNVILSSFKQLQKHLEFLNVYLPGNLKINNIFTAVTVCGCFLDTALSIGEKRAFLWKINGLLAWVLLVLTSSLVFSNHYNVHICSIKVLATSSLLCYYFWVSPSETTTNTKEYQFKKISKVNDAAETSEEESEEDITDAYSLMNHSPRTYARSTYAPLNESFTAKNVNSTSDLYDFSRSSSSDINRSLDNLHLTNLGQKWQKCASPLFSANSSMKRSILSPARLNISQNSWSSATFWKNDASVFNATGFTNLSRSSSQSSGFESIHEHPAENPFGYLPTEPPFGGDVDKVSISSEPAYHFSPISPSATTVGSTKNPTLYYKTDNNTFYPVLNPNSMLFIQNGIPRQTFATSSLNNVDLGAKSISSASLYSEKQFSPLFKNLRSTESFRKPQF